MRMALLHDSNGDSIVGDFSSEDSSHSEQIESSEEEKESEVRRRGFSSVEGSQAKKLVDPRVFKK